MKTTLDNLSTNLLSMVISYKDDIAKEIEYELENTADKIIDYIKKNCPRGNSELHLADSFIKTEIGFGSNKVIYISSEKKGRLVHLIELGFKHRNGKFVKARPFMRPAYNEFSLKMLDEIKKIISKGE